MKAFNTTGLCIPEKHYMVDITDRLRQIQAMVDAGKYFCINRARQYGKTTTLAGLERTLAGLYVVISLDFQDIGSASFQKENDFCQALARNVLSVFDETDISPGAQALEQLNELTDRSRTDVKMDELMTAFATLCQEAALPVVLIIDEVDSAADSQPFLDFLAQLRSRYLRREAGKNVHTFQSVILAGVTDIRHLQGKIRDEDQHRVNSPWNIASDFKVDMSFSPDDIEGMLRQYEADHHTGMDAKAVAAEIHSWTSGYPFLVSRICQLIDENLDEPAFGTAAQTWGRRGIDEAVKHILDENNTLFDSLTGKLTNYPQLKDALHAILMKGESLSYNQLQESVAQLQMYGFIVRDGGSIAVSNRIFETLLYNLFLSEDELEKERMAGASAVEKSMFITAAGQLDVPLILERFVKTYHEIFGPLEERFQEKDGRELFLLYLKPIINGTGNYYIESQTRDQRRMDVVIDYLGQRYVIELKIWRGPRYNAEGELQLSSYLDYFDLDVGYMLSFNFNKEKTPGVRRVEIGEKVLFEATV